MATKPRHLKTPIQLWVADNRKRLGLTPADLAALTGVTVDTARGWESRGAPSQDAIETLTRRFGVKPPVAGSASLHVL
jgi:DNA-binding transcriptional regulator YiaG